MIAVTVESVSRSQSLKDQGKSRTSHHCRLCSFGCRNPLKIRASLGHGEWIRCDTEGGRNPLKIRASLGLDRKDENVASLSRNPLKIRASLGLWTAWHSHVDSRFHCANIRHKREEKVAGLKLIHIKSLLAF